MIRRILDRWRSRRLDRGLTAPVPPPPEPYPRPHRDSVSEGFACRMPERPWVKDRHTEPPCGRAKSPAEPTCRRQLCVESYAADLEAAHRSEARRDASEPKRPAKVLPMEGRW
jgi:hypothetical protein